jgi:hypothetical protein
MKSPNKKVCKIITLAPGSFLECPMISAQRQHRFLSSVTTIEILIVMLDQVCFLVKHFVKSWLISTLNKVIYFVKTILNWGNKRKPKRSRVRSQPWQPFQKFTGSAKTTKQEISWKNVSLFPTCFFECNYKEFYGTYLHTAQCCG